MAYTNCITYRNGTGGVKECIERTFINKYADRIEAKLKGNPGEMNTLVQTFSNGVQLVFIMNSDLPAGIDYGSAVTDAFYETMQPQK